MRVAESEDLLTEILLRLPGKPLTTFKCVSKQWYALISHPRFLRRYLTSNRFPSSLLLAPFPMHSRRHRAKLIPPLAASPPPTLIDFGFLNVPHLALSVAQSCNGLLLVQGTHKDKRWPLSRETRRSNLFVCNPITERSVAITGIATKSNFFLAYDPLKSLHFKLVSVQSVHRFASGETTLAWGDYYTNEVAIYSSETACWSDTRVCFTTPPSMNMDLGVYCNGSVHWYIKAKESFYFDVESQCLKTYPMPPNIENHEKSHFGESRGRLHMILMSPQLFLYDIFELEEDYSAWSLRFHKLDLSPMQAAFRGMNWYFEDDVIPLFDILCVVRHKSEDDFVLLLLIPDRVVLSYNVLDATVRELSELQPIVRSHAPWVGGYTFVAFEYIENLSPVGGFTA
ncbi:F-box protein At5g07610 [Cajanus cajan]|nr:F-box protein At5g07610 [Cajanus cajan]